jgi:tetratricopeptide (TPR) repeat protein
MDKSLMVMMSFTDWLNYFKTKQQREKEEERDKKALKTSWQKEKLAAAVEEDVDEIPEPIFKQAMDSITMESNMISESLAKILATQGKTDKAIDMYKKLSLRNPEKSSYFANLIENLNSKRD